MAELDNWLRQATRCLAKDAVVQVRTEIQEHYESAREAALADGATIEDAETCALRALGDAKTVNDQYRRVLLTAAEARLLRESNWEARVVCSQSWLKRLILIVPVVMAAAFIVLVLTGHAAVARDVLLCGLGLSPWVVPLLFPIDTLSHGRVFRYFKWLAMTVAVLLLFGHDTVQWSWLLISCLWPVGWIEATRASIRRKLPLNVWPRHLYL